MGVHAGGRADAFRSFEEHPEAWLTRFGPVTVSKWPEAGTRTLMYTFQVRSTLTTFGCLPEFIRHGRSRSAPEAAFHYLFCLGELTMAGFLIL